MIGDTSSLGVGCAIMATSIPSNTCGFSRTILPPFPSAAGVPITDNYKCNGFSGVRVTRSLVLYVCFVDRCLSFCTFSFGHCVVCSYSIYRFWLPLWYVQTRLFRPFGFIAPYVVVQCFDCEHTCFKLFQKRAVHTKLDIYVFIQTVDIMFNYSKYIFITFIVISYWYPSRRRERR
jgi:hypothetical protein